MLGAIAGDIIGKPYEFTFKNIKNTKFPLFSERSRFSDDTVMTIAVAMGVMQGYNNPEKTKEFIIDAMHYYGNRFPRAGYGQKFAMWIFRKQREPYNSYGNGAAMRVSPVAWAYNTLEDVEFYAELSSAITHNHPDGIKGACAIATSIFLARTGSSKDHIKKYIATQYGYNLSRSLDDIRAVSVHSEKAADSVPEAITAFLHSTSFEDAIRIAISLGGDSDTIASMCGSIAEAYYGGVPENIWQECILRMEDPLLAVLATWKKWIAVHR